MRDFRNLKVWQRSHELVLWTYRITAEFPRDEVFGLRHSMRKAAVDSAGFVAEGSAKPSDGEFATCISAAVAIDAKLEYYALVASDLGFIGKEAYDAYANEIIEVKKMLQGFKKRLISEG